MAYNPSNRNPHPFMANRGLVQTLDSSDATIENIQSMQIDASNVNITDLSADHFDVLSTANLGTASANSLIVYGNIEFTGEISGSIEAAIGGNIDTRITQNEQDISDLQGFVTDLSNDYLRLDGGSMTGPLSIDKVITDINNVFEVSGNSRVYGDLRVDGSFNLGVASVTLFDDGNGNLIMQKVGGAGMVFDFGSTNPTIKPIQTSGGNDMILIDNTTDTYTEPQLVLSTPGKVGIGTSDPRTTLDVSGDVLISKTGNNTTTSLHINAGNHRDSYQGTSSQFIMSTRTATFGGENDPDFMIKHGPRSSWDVPTKFIMGHTKNNTTEIQEHTILEIHPKNDPGLNEDPEYYTKFNQKIGIGKNPTYNFDVSGSTNTNLAYITNSETNTVRKSFFDTGTDTHYEQFGASGSGTNTSAGKVMLSGINATNKTMLVDLLNQKVGIRQSNPVGHLDINGDICGTNVQIADTLTVADVLTVDPNGTYDVDVNGSIKSSTLSLPYADADKIYLLDNGAVQAGVISHGSGWEMTYSSGKTSGVTANEGQHVFKTATSSGYVERMRIDKDGKVGINTRSPGEKLDICGNIRLSGDLKSGDGSSILTKPNGQPTHIYGTVNFWNGDNENSTFIKNNGSVGIGIDPVYNLDLSGNFRLSDNLLINGGVSDTDWITVKSNNGGTQDTIFKVSDENSSGKVLIGSRFNNGGTVDTTNYTVRLHSEGTSWLNGGNVGIGTTNPSDKLHLYDGEFRVTNSRYNPTFDLSDSADIIIENIYPVSVGATNYGYIGKNIGSIAFRGDANPHYSNANMRTCGRITSLYDNPNNASGTTTGNSSSGSTALAFYTSYGVAYNDTDNNNVTLNEKMRISGNGNVGIGTTSPGSKLEVNGDISGANLNLTGTITLKNNEDSHTYMTFKQIDGLGGNDHVVFKSGTVPNQGEFIIELQDEDDANQWFILRNNTKNIYSSNKDNHYFYVNNVEKMRITSDGNVGIGTTSPSQKIEVNGYISAYDSSKLPFKNTSGATLIPSKILFGNAFSPLIRTRYPNNAHTDAQYLDFVNVVESNTTINDTTTPTMTIGPVGKVGIGNTTPVFPLEVYGSANQVFTARLSYIDGNGGLLPTDIDYNEPISIHSQNGIWADRLLISSDMRIKKNFKDIDDNDALNKLRRLKPTKYEYIDMLNKGNNIVLGFIAQEVREVIPNSVTLVNNIIPDYYELVENIQFHQDNSNNTLTFDISDTYDISIGTNIKLYIKDDNDTENEYITSVINISDSNIEIQLEKDIVVTQVFFYGKEVNDFHSLNKESIWTVATAALQEVDRQLQAEKAKVSELTDELVLEKQKVATLETQMTDVLARLTALENR